jgi:hypothetical protein
MTAMPHARGARIAWETVPPHIKEAVRAYLDDEIVAVDSMAGGFSPGVAAILHTGRGERVFIKAVSASPNEVAPTFHRREILVSSHLPPDAPVPKLLWSLDEGLPTDAVAGWVVLIYEAVTGRELAQPWQAYELDRVIEALNDLATSLTPSPIARDIIGSVSDPALERTNYWALLHDQPPAALDPWARRHLDRLTDIGENAADALAGDTLLHFDLRADNMLLTDHGVVIVDWPHARIGAAWLDPLAMAPSVAMHGGPDPEAFLGRCLAARGADPDHITAGIADIAGYFTYHALLPEAPGLPGLREFQEAQAVVSRRWLAQRTGWL